MPQGSRGAAEGGRGAHEHVEKPGPQAGQELTMGMLRWMETSETMAITQDNLHPGDPALGGNVPRLPRPQEVKYNRLQHPSLILGV